MARRALVTGAASGIGRATVKALRKDGYDVLATSRRMGQLKALAEETGCEFCPADLTSEDGRANLLRYIALGEPIDILVNVAGGALGTDPVANGKLDEWRQMFELNVLATLALTQSLLPHMREAGGDVVFITSTAAHGTYPGGAGYTAAKHAERMIPNTLRLELVGEPVRLIEIAPGMVKTEEFSLNRLHGDAAAAENVYAGVAEPLIAEDIAEAVRWCVGLPAHMNIDSMIIRPVAQASNTLVARKL